MTKPQRLNILHFIRDCRRDGSFTASEARYWINRYLLDRKGAIIANVRAYGDAYSRRAP